MYTTHGKCTGKHYCKDCGKELKNLYAVRCKACSNKSRSTGWTPYNICKDCGKRIWKPAQRCRSCSSKGSLGSNWQGGITPIYQAIRNLPEMSEWRRQIFVRDNYTCTICGKTGCILNADHIYPFKWILTKFNIQSVADALACKFLWDISNGRTLCEACHKETKTFAGKIRRLGKLT